MLVFAFPMTLQLQVVEKLVVRAVHDFPKVRYAYHYQRANGELVFRYDNVPHYPDIKTFPHHKHVGDARSWTAAEIWSEVLREIDGVMYALQRVPPCSG